jgi:hypothetical protein
LDPVDDKSDLVTVFIQNNGQVSWSKRFLA